MNIVPLPQNYIYMKKFLFMVVLSVFVTSCKITEKVEIKDDGSVSYRTEFDFSEMMGFMYDEATKDSLRAIGEFPIDTVVNFDQANNLNNSKEGVSAAEKEFTQALHKMKVYMKMNDNEGQMSFGFDEKNINAFNAYFNDVQKAVEKFQKEDPKGAQDLTQSGLLNSFNIKYDGKKFEKKSLESAKSVNEQLSDSAYEASKQMMSMFTYRVQYKFPKKIKSSTLENATLSMDGKTITAEFPAIELFEDHKKRDFKVEFE